jgi:hypothetical protein
MSDYDITGKIGPLYPEAIPNPCEWPMYSFARPAYILWNAIAAELHAMKWTDTEIKAWLQAKDTRWALDGDLGDIPCHRRQTVRPLGPKGA